MLQKQPTKQKILAKSWKAMAFFDVTEGGDSYLAIASQVNHAPPENGHLSETNEMS